MDILLENIKWMFVNLFLAFLGVTFGFLFLYAKQKFIKFMLGFLWIIFLPNTIYILTDIQHFPEQFVKLNFYFQVVLIFQYLLLLILGCITFVYGLLPAEKTILKLKGKKNLLVPAISILNLLIGFGVVLGKETRTHSWYLFTDLPKVINDLKITLSTPSYLIFAILFALLGNLIYFGFKKAIISKN